MGKQEPCPSVKTSVSTNLYCRIIKESCSFINEQPPLGKGFNEGLINI